jgi:putative ABC transport system permease protein
VLYGINSFLDDKNKELNGSDFTVVTQKVYNELVETVVDDMGQYKKLESEDAMIKDTADFKNITLDDKAQSVGCLYLNADDSGSISKLVIIDEGKEKLANSIILPYYLKASKGYRTGDEISISYGGKTNKHVIYGFAEDVMFAVPSNITLYKCYVFEDEFQRIYQEETNVSQAVLIKTKLEEGTDTAQYEEDFVKKINETKNEDVKTVMSFDYTTMKIGVSIFLIIIMAILIVFSLIILMITLTIIRFAIVTHIEGNIKNIGSMEAMGYTGKQLIVATVFQFLIIALIGFGVGLLLSFFSIGTLTNIVSSSIGLAWKTGISIPAILISFIVVTILVIIITYFAAKKIKKITPIIALRQGIDTHNFKKNYFPLNKYNRNINLVVGLKTLIQNMRQNVMITLIISLMSFVSVFAFTINYNFNVDNTAFIRLVGLEKADLAVSCVDEKAPTIFNEISSMDNVERTSRISNLNMAVSFGNKEITPSVNICNDYDLLETNTIVKGRYPKHDNEIAITGLVSNYLQAEIGDVVIVAGKNNKQEFIVVGVTQQINYLGKGASLTEEGMLRLNNSFVPTTQYLYLENDSNLLSITKVIEDKYGNIVNVSNVKETFDTILASFNSAVKVLGILCLVITISIIGLVLFLLIRIRLLKEKTRIGLAKALGYTTKQLIVQIIISFCPVCILGAFIGTIMALYLVNPAFSFMLSVSGIFNSNLIINPLLTFVIFISLSLVSILITALVASRIRKITPCELFI